MIWLTWRQFRVQAFTAIGVLAVLGGWLVYLGLRIRDSYAANVDCTSGCSTTAARETLQNDYFNPLLLTGFVILAVPVLIGAFWGAPLIAREFEAGTNMLAWNQSVVRRRWLAVKLTVVALAGVVLTGALSLGITWAASPYDELSGQRFEALTFPTRNIVPLGYAVFAIVLGATAGLLARRSVPAMAVTFAVFAALQILIPTVVRPHLQSPVTETVALDAEAFTHEIRVNAKGGDVTVDGYVMPNAWTLTDSIPLLDASGTQLTESRLKTCLVGDPGGDAACLTTLDLHFVVTYQPADRYWTFQWLELTAFLALAGLLTGFAFWRIPRGPS